MKKLFLICLMATTILAFNSCRKDPIYIDDNGNVIDSNRKPIASFTYSTQQITGGLAIKCNNTSSYATSFVIAQPAIKPIRLFMYIVLAPIDWN